MPKHKRKNCKLLVIRRGKSEDYLMESKPCSMCTQIIQASGIGTVMYSTSEGSITRMKPEKLTDTRYSKGGRSFDETHPSFFRKKIKQIVNRVRSRSPR